MGISTVKLNGVTLITVNDTTAIASDVASGKYFYTADGTKTEGSHFDPANVWVSGYGYYINNGVLVHLDANTRAAYASNVGDHCIKIYLDNQDVDSSYYPIELPEGATSIDAVISSGSDVQYKIYALYWNDSTNQWVQLSQIGFVATGSLEIPEGATHWIAAIKKGSAGTETVTETDTDSITFVVDSNNVNLQSKTATPTESTQTITADTGYDGLSSVEVGAISSTYIGSSITQRSSSDLTASGATITVPSGYYSEQATKSIAAGTEGTPTAAKGTVSNHSIAVTPSVTNTAGYISGGTKTGTAVTVSASELVSGNKAIISNGTDIDVTNFSTVSVDVPSSQPNLQSKTNINPTTSSQTIQPDSGYDGLSSVQINAMPSGTAGTPSASKGTVSNHSVSVTPSVTNTTGYITGNTLTGTAVIVSASELVSGNLAIDQNGTGIDVTNYATVSVDVPSSQPNLQSKTNISPSTSSQTITADNGYDGLSSVQINAMPSGSAGTPSASKGTVSNHSVSITPSVTNTTGYITGGTLTGTAITVSASELVSGSQTISQNGTVDVTNLASVAVSIPIVTYYTGSSAPASSLGSNGDIYLQS